MTQEDQTNNGVQELVRLVQEVVQRHETLFIEVLAASQSHATAIVDLRQDMQRFCEVISEQSKVINRMQDCILELQRAVAVPDVTPPAPPSAPN
jgi:hypothetical protein